MNCVNLIGNLGRDPELRTTTSGKQVCNFSLAVQDPFSKDKTDWFEIVAWGNQAEFASKYLKKGNKVGLTGRMEPKSYEKDGHKVKTIEVVANQIYGLSPKPTTQDQPSGEYDPFEDD